jgi:NAD(P)-dependent dehydrogenase (short-subunit alcohol dehydrogenase family)
MGGSYAIDESQRASAIQAALVGVCKAVGREMPRLSVKNIDLDMTQPPDMVFPHLLQEIAIASAVEEIGVRDGARMRVDVAESPISVGPDEIDLDADSVVLVTGGARGVTAVTAEALARQTGSRFVLVGRTAIPKEESPELKLLEKAAAIRQHFIAESRASGQPLSPAQIERNVQAVLRDREIRRNIDAIGEHAAEIIYEAVDVRDEGEFSGLIESIYQKWGRIDAVIHGAGLIEDKLIRDKTPESFERVFGTKVDSAQTLVRCLRPETLKYLVFFSSISGRFGNAGQADYSAANEYLSKLARKLDAEWPARVVAIAWGPWDGGMVSDELRRMYLSRGIHPIPPEAGAAAMINEMRLRQGPPEVLLGCNIREIAELTREGAAA